MFPAFFLGALSGSDSPCDTLVKLEVCSPARVCAPRVPTGSPSWPLWWTAPWASRGRIGGPVWAGVLRGQLRVGGSPGWSLSSLRAPVTLNSAD